MNTSFPVDEEKRSAAVLKPVGPGNELQAAELFQQLLSLERKRSERSRRKMAILLIDLTGLEEGLRNSATEKITGLLFQSTRETDLKGWYSEHRVIGVLYTEINEFDRNGMLGKIRAGLASALPPRTYAQIDISLHLFPDDSDTVPRSGLPANPVLYPDLGKKAGRKQGMYRSKRAIDVAGSLAGLLLFSPLFLVLPLLIKVTSRGPVLFRQERIGLYGKKFTFLKFRTMYANNDSSIHREYVKKLISGKIEDSRPGSSADRPVYKIVHDKRVTAIGKFLRKTSLDEVPQFINVLCGSMSLVGPRPAIEYEVEQYDLWHRRRVIEIKPGITGLWQVMGRSSTTFEEMVRLDLRYAAACSMGLDLKLLLLTPWAVIRGKGAF